MKFLTTILFFLVSITVTSQKLFRWRQISGPLTTTLLTPDSSHCVVTGLNVIGRYEYEFTWLSKYGDLKDTTLITVIGGALGIPQDSVYQITRPEIKRLEIKIFAHPGDIFFQIKSPVRQQIVCTISDAAGRLIGKIDFELKKGANLFTAPKPRVNGVYIIQFTTYFESVTKKIFI